MGFFLTVFHDILTDPVRIKWAYDSWIPTDPVQMTKVYDSWIPRHWPRRQIRCNIRLKVAFSLKVSITFSKCHCRRKTVRSVLHNIFTDLVQMRGAYKDSWHPQCGRGKISWNIKISLILSWSLSGKYVAQFLISGVFAAWQRLQWSM